MFLNRFLLVGLLSLLALLLSSISHADIFLPRIFGDDMVLQRDRPIPIWGIAAPGAIVQVSMAGEQVSTQANRLGEWNVEFEPKKAGGPHVLKVTSNDESIERKNILMGDVWLCSGQSNMEWPVKNSANATKEIAQANYPQVRMFTVEKNIAFSPKESLKGGVWHSAQPEAVGDFSAVGFFFGRHLHQELNIPIGLIHSSWGGTGIEAWTSWEEVRKREDYSYLHVRRIEREAHRQEARMARYQQALASEQGVKERWYSNSSSLNDWSLLNGASKSDNVSVRDIDGVVWLRTDFSIANSPAGKPAILNLAIDNIVAVYINGELVDLTQDKAEPRKYHVESEILKSGRNTLVIRVEGSVPSRLAEKAFFF